MKFLHCADIHSDSPPRGLLAAVEQSAVASIPQALAVPQKQVSKWPARAVADGFLAKRERVYRIGEHHPLVNEQLLGAPNEISDVGRRAAARVSASATTQAQAERSIAGAHGVELALAKQWLREAANDRS